MSTEQDMDRNEARGIINDAMDGKRTDKVRKSLPLALFALGIDADTFANLQKELAKVTVERPKNVVPFDSRPCWH